MEHWINKNFKDSPPFIAFMVARQAADTLFERERKTLQGYFEAVIFTYSCIIDEVGKSRPKFRKIFFDDCLKILLRFMYDLKIEKELPLEPVRFVVTRIEFYIDQIEALRDNERAMPIQLYSLFYEKPLTEIPANSLNLPNVLMLQVKLNIVFIFLNKASKILIESDEKNQLVEDYLGNYSSIGGCRVNNLSILKNESGVEIKFLEVIEVGDDEYQCNEYDFLDTNPYLDGNSTLIFTGVEVDYDGTRMPVNFEFKFIDGKSKLVMERIFFRGERELYGTLKKA